MIAYKFLGFGATGVYSGFRWPTPENGHPGRWVDVRGDLVACVNGIHACSRAELVDWIDEELWLVELAGRVEETESGLLARRGRLCERVRRWDTEAAGALAEACVWRARDHAVASLRRAGLAAAADELGRQPGLAELQALAVARLETTSGEAAQAFAYVADAVELARGGRPDWYTRHPAGSMPAGPGAIAANLAYVTAAAAGALAADGSDDADTFARGFAAERDWQRAWLGDRLELEAA